MRKRNILLGYSSLPPCSNLHNVKTNKNQSNGEKMLRYDSLKLSKEASIVSKHNETNDLKCLRNTDLFVVILLTFVFNISTYFYNI